MSGQSDQQPPQGGATGVPDLIERYRLRRDAWIAQADELARLRDEVRASAEREAMEIVTAARRDVRKVIMEARRELLVLSAQVQAALGEAPPKADPVTLLNKAGITPEPGAIHSLTGAIGTFAPEDAVNEILNEVQDDMTALAEDARALPLQAVPVPVRQITAPVSPAPEPIAPAPLRVMPPAAHQPASAHRPPVAYQPPMTHAAPIEPPAEIEIPELTFPPEAITFPPADTGHDEVRGLSESASKVLLSSPFPSDAVPVQHDKRFRIFVALFVGVGATVAGVTIWWLSSGSSSNEVAATPAPTESAAPSVPGGPSGSESATVSTTPRSSTGKGNLSVVAEAVRDVWIRTTIDGRTDGGQTLAAGESIDVSAEQSISLRVGDAGAVVVSVNGEKRPLGRDGEVLTRTFVAESAAAPVRVPAPQPAPAPAAPSTPATPARALPPVASSAPVVAPRVPPPPPAPSPAAGNVATATPLSAPPTPVPAPTPAPPSQLTSGASQVAIPNGVVNQLTAPAAPLAAPAAAPTSASPATMVVAVARQWLDAYHRQDRATMAALSTDNLLLADERRADERFPSGLADVTRTLDRVSVQIAADTAVLTAVMMEQSSSTAPPHVSPISQVWVLGGGQWKVRQARFVSEARLNSVFK